MKELLSSFLPNIETVVWLLYLVLMVAVVYFYITAKNLFVFCVAVLIVLSAMKPIAYDAFFGVKGFQLIYVWWIFTLLMLFFGSRKGNKGLRIREFLSVPLILLLIVQAVAWINTFSSGADHSYYHAGFDRLSLFFGYFMSPVQVLLTGWMVMLASENKEDLATIETSIILSGAIFGTLILITYLNKGAFYGGPESLWLGREAINEFVGEEINGLGGICVLFFIGCVLFRNAKIRWLKYVCLVALVLGTLFTLSRMAWVALAVVTLLMFPKISWRKKLLIFFCLAFCWWRFHTVIWNRINYGFDKNVSSNIEMIDEVSAGRVSLWKDAWVQVEKNPIMGSGIQTGVIMSDGRIAYHPHSAYLRVLLDMGWLGMLIVVTCYMHFFMRASKNKGPLYYSIITLAIMGIVCLEFHIHKQTYLIWIYYGLLRNEKTEVAKGKKIRQSDREENA